MTTTPTTPKRIAAERYQRAAAFLPQNVAPQLSGMVQDGYWIDGHRYFFCATDVVSGFPRSVPTIADAVTGKVAPVLPADTLAELISPAIGKTLSAADLIAARYEMPDSTTLVVMLGLDVFRVSLDGPTLLEATKLDPTPMLHSPDGQQACFVKGFDLWLKDLATGETQPITSDGEARNAYGAMIESGTQPLAARHLGLPMGLWSADSQWFVSHRIDERHLPEAGLVQHAPPGGGRPVVHSFKVAGPDVETPKAEFVAYHLPSGRRVRARDHTVSTQAFSPFMTRQCWFVGEQLYFFDWDRFSSAVSLMTMDLASGASGTSGASGAVRTVLSETTESGWLGLHPFVLGQPMVRVLQSSGEVIWYSEADGRGHLYLHDLATGALKNRITHGPWLVRELVHVDEDQRRILFMASDFEDASDPAQRRLCAVNFDGSGFTTICATEGDLIVRPTAANAADQLKPYRPSYASSGASGDARYVAASAGSIDTPTRWLLIQVATGEHTEIARMDIEKHWTAPRPQAFEALAADGKTKLVGVMYVPSDFDAAKSYPLIDYIYPGPQLNLLARRFPNSSGLLLQAAIELGMVGIILETRGMPNRDHAFHQAGHGSLMEPQLSDHAAVIEQLCQRHSFLDRNRVGMFGQSGGGHATARAMFDYADTFKVGVAVCGNHDSRNYIGQWIDKYGGRPGTSERDEQANSTAAHKLQGKLLLVHGDMDDNVHPGHTLALSAALIAANKDFDQLIVPGATHSVLSESPYVVQRLWTYFVRHLLELEPPADFKLAWTPIGAAAAKVLLAADLS